MASGKKTRDVSPGIVWDDKSKSWAVRCGKKLFKVVYLEADGKSVSQNKES